MISYKYGARVYSVQPKVVVISQTVKPSNSKEYKLDLYSNGKQRKKHINMNDDKAIADAVRHALVGKL